MSEELITIKLLEMCGPHCVGIEEGDNLFNKIVPLLKTGNKVCMDFKDIATVTSSFLNASVGKLFGQFENGSLEAHISWENLDENDEGLINLVIRNAKEHFAKTKREKKIEEDIVKNIPETENNV